jgi:DNA (cytosine-5)-methyltransferase 1
MTDLTAVSLFAGVGGFDLAMERNGINVVATVEIDKNARGVLQHQFPNTQHFTDVTTVTGEDLRNAGFIPERGIITGGFPCQDLSVAGKRAGLVGARSGLFYEIARIADETKAKWLVLENVPGLLTSQRGADMGAVVGTLVELGYGVAWRVLDAQHFGVPQRRRRVFIVAERAGDPTGPAEVLFKRTSVRGDSSTSGTPREEVTGDAGPSIEVTSVHRMTAIGQYAEDDDTSSNATDLVIEPVAFDEMNFTTTAMHQTLRAGTPQSTGVIEPTLYEPHHGDGRATEGIANTLAARMGTGGNNTPVLVEPVAFSQNQREEVRIMELAGALGIGNDGDPQFTISAHHPHAVATVVAPTLTAYNMDSRSPQSEESQRIVGSVFNATGTVRRLTPTECERLQGFPDGWTSQRIDEKKGLIEQADSSRYKQMGNAVAVPCVEWIMARLVEQDNGR